MMPEAVACARLDVISVYSGFVADMQGSWNVSRVGLFMSCYYNIIECQSLEVYSPVLSLQGLSTLLQNTIINHSS